MGSVLVGKILRQYRQLHERALALAMDLSDEQLARAETGSTNAIGWNLWHIARWVDVCQFEIATVNADVRGSVGPPRQVWTEGRFAERWGLPAAALGFWETGMETAHGDAAVLPLPAKNELLEYVRVAFAAAESVIGALEDRHLAAEYTSMVYGTTASYLPTLLTHIAHGNRHLGMIEAQRGVSGLRGTATV